MGKTVSIFADGEIPKQLSFLQDIEVIQTTLPKENTEYDLLIIVDMSSDDRMGIFEALRDVSKSTICFDHHINTTTTADIVFAEPECASCGEIVYDFFIQNKIEITPQIANALYTALSTDTGCFLYPSTTAHTHRVAAALMEQGAYIELINYHCFRVYDRKLNHGLRQVLRNLKFRQGGQIAFSVLKKGSFDGEERDKFKQYISDIRGVRIGVFLMREDDKRTYYGSLRSHGELDVSRAARALGGGGHKNAAGFTVVGTYQKVMHQVLAEVEKTLEDGRISQHT